MNKTKKCYKCGLEKDITDFYSNKSKYDGKSTECKVCSSELSKVYNAKKQEKLKLISIDESKIPEFKKCSKCKEIKSSKLFHRSKKAKDFLKSKCKDCMREYHYIRVSNNSKNRVSIRLKTCTRCNIEKDVSEFHKNTSTKDGYATICVECNKPISTKYYENNKESVSLNSKIRKHKIRALKKNKNQRFCKSDILKLKEKQQYKCYYCDIDISGGYHIDHYIPISKGGSNLIENIVLACAHCNLSKRNKDPLDFIKQMNEYKENYGQK